jgi:hypothetical protein
MRTERSRTSITEALGENTIGLAMPDALSEFIFNLMPGDSEDEPEEKNVQPMAEVAFDLACPVCFELPAGEVHQCFEGHCYCVDCWRRLNAGVRGTRRCPECRDPLPLRNRSRAQEARIAALPAVCDHCDQTTTRGAMAEHLRACQQRPITCLAAAAGCGLEGMAAGQATAKQPLSGRVRALDDEEEEEEGGRRRRQRVGPAPHDAPPSDAPPSVANMTVMGMTEATAALREHVTVARVAEATQITYTPPSHAPAVSTARCPSARNAASISRAAASRRRSSARRTGDGASSA